MATTAYRVSNGSNSAQPRPSVAQQVSDLSSTANNLVQASTSSAAGASNGNPNAFRAPAHKHAHHLHSIPPREKSTRTLIIDHMLWVHGRTRFAQARAELGMTDRTGGPGTPQYAHRHRPENYEEEDDVGSDGEDAVTLKARAGDPGRPHNDDEDERLRSQDLSLARSLRLRAEGLEKVVTSMLDQPPAPHRPFDEDVLTPPTSPRIAPAKTQHALPNGVRLRLALGTMINDLFARQAPVPPERHRRVSSAAASPAQTQPTSTSPVPPLPPSLAALATISASCPSDPAIQPWTRPSSSMRPGPGPLYPVQPRVPPVPSVRTHTLYDAGADPSTANSPPAFRCPRHLHTGCEICVEAKMVRPGAGAGRGRGSGMGGSSGADGGGGGGRTQYWKAMPGGVSPEGGGITGWQDGSGIGSGLSRPARMGTVLRRRMHGHTNTTTESEGPNTGVGNTKLTELIARFMRLSAMVAAEMGREARGEEEEPASPGEDKDAEDGDEDGEGEGEEGDSSTSPESMVVDQQPPADDLEPLPPPATPLPSNVNANPYENQTPMYSSALLPSREWYLLLAGLLTRAVLEGYLTGGWRGPDAVDCLLKVGLGMPIPPSSSPPKEQEAFGEFDPDELPSLLDAARMLFPALRYGTNSGVAKGQAEEEFEMEMETRLRRFYDIPQSTPDLSTHMEDLAWQYPAEPVERAAVRFCEAIEKWRGKPELETYKKKASVLDTPSSSMSVSVGTGTGTGTIASSVPGSMLPPHPRSTRKPSIDVYFPQPFLLQRRRRSRHTWDANGNGNGTERRNGNNKRMREPDGGGAEGPALN